MFDRLKYLLALFFSLPVLFSGCSLLSGNVATLWTNQPEFAAYVELFNTSQKRYKIEIAYRALPAQSLASATKLPDIIVGDRLSSVNVIGEFTPLDQLFGKGGIEAGQFYKHLLSSGRHEGRQYLLPVSFDLPLVLSEKSAKPAGSKQNLLTLDAIFKASEEFSKKSKASLKVMGFSPLWNPDFLFSTAELMGADFHQTTRGNLAWDEQKLQKAIAEMRKWVKQIDGGAQEETVFREKYLYDPVDKLLASGRILYYYMSLSKYFAVPEEKRKSVEFRWFAAQSHIPVVENVLYVGVPARSRNKGAAYAFLKWFFRSETQSQLLEMSRYERIKTFGIGSGLSALSVVNERDFPQYYPVLLGKIPPADDLAFPRSLPSDWGDLKANVIIPWMRSEVLAPNSEQALDVRLKAWRLQKPLP